jgi:hypothetical protein
LEVQSNISKITVMNDVFLVLNSVRDGLLRSQVIAGMECQRGTLLHQLGSLKHETALFKKASLKNVIHCFCSYVLHSIEEASIRKKILMFYAQY